jgi:hypothetical protein
MLKRLLLVSVLTIVLFGWSSPIMADDSRADEQKNAGNALLLDPSKVVERTPTEVRPIHNPAGSEMIVAGLTIPVICDGYIDPTEWADAFMYDVSDTTGQSDGLVDPLGSVSLWLKQDDNGVYFAIRNNADQTLDDYDQVGLYFDDNYDGCWPVSATNEGNSWLVYDAVGGDFVQWRWIQDFDCSFPPSYLCAGDEYGGFYNWTPSCFGIGIGPTGNVDFEVMIPYGVIDEYLDLTMPPDTLGFYMYCMDYGPYVYNGEWPSQYYSTTYNEPCYFGRLICGEVEEWPNHKMHFPQLPDLEGWDVHAVFPKTLADDWQCSETGEILDIHFWGSWKDIDGDPYTDNFYTPMPWFGLSIHSNLPVGHPDNPFPYSIPGELLWWWDGEIEGIPFEPPAMEHWFNPNTGEVLYNDHVPYWRYDFFFDQASPTPEPFFQYQDSIYWLNIAVEPSTSPPPYEWGWKTSRDHFMDDAVYTDNPPDGPWYEMYEPPRANWFDVYFNSFGEPDDMGSTNYYGQGWYFYEWYYWWNMWFYDNPYVPNPKHFWLEFYIEPVGPEAYAEFAINFSTPEWDMLEMGRPPLPQDGEEDLYIGRIEYPVYLGENFIDDWLDWNPEWISIDFRAWDVIINGWIWHECVQTSMDMAFVITGEEEPNNPPEIGQPDFLEGYVDSVLEYDITGNDPDGDVILDEASIDIQPGCGNYSITRTSGHGTSTGTWQVTWYTDGCTVCDTHLVIHDLTDERGATGYCTTWVHIIEKPQTGWYWKDPYPDYAPNGMVDIDQRQDTWLKYDTEQWSFCGPCAVANCFKWFDSKYNVPPGAPGDGADQFPLVRQYIDAFGGMISPWDDHDPWNVDHPATPWNPAIGPPPPTVPQPFVPGPQPPGMPPWGELVERLAWYFNTDGIQTEYCEFTGTNVMDMQAGIDAWLRSETFQDGSSLFDTLCEVTTPMPTFTYVESLVEKCEDVILLLGFWYEDPPGSGAWFRIGGHYVTVAGVNSEQSMIAFSDPFIDAFEVGLAPGRVGDGYLIPHPHGYHDATIHNDEGNVCHDMYAAVPSPSPGGLWGLPEYPIMADPYYWSWNFFNQNVPAEFVPVTAPWTEVSPIFTEVEYCVHISPWDYRGDCNVPGGDGVIDAADIVFLINHVFTGTSAPTPYYSGDCNCDGIIDVADIILLINHVFGGTSAPRCCDP